VKNKAVTLIAAFFLFGSLAYVLMGMFGTCDARQSAQNKKKADKCVAYYRNKLPYMIQCGDAVMVVRAKGP
jgi:hypothetical protein